MSYSRDIKPHRVEGTQLLDILLVIDIVSVLTVQVPGGQQNDSLCVYVYVYACVCVCVYVVPEREPALQGMVPITIQ